VVRRRGGRNTNNDRYVYINVDDSPTPIPELRRLLDMNLGLLYTEKVGPLLLAHQSRSARCRCPRRALHASSKLYFDLGVMDYHLGDKTTALADFRQGSSSILRSGSGSRRPTRSRPELVSWLWRSNKTRSS
jgi:hypothetical protein